MATNRNNSAKQNRYTKNSLSGKFHPLSQAGSPTYHRSGEPRKGDLGNRKNHVYIIAKDNHKGSISVKHVEAEVTSEPSITISDKISDVESKNIHFSEDSYNRVWREIVSNRKK